MGLGSNKRGGGGNYLGIYGGKIVKEWRKSKPSEDQIPLGKELQERELSMGPNKGNTVWFIEYDYVSGLIENIKLDTEGKFGDQIILTVKDIDETYILQLNADSSYGTDFLMKLANLDIEEDISFEPWTMTPQEWFDLTGRKANGNRSGLTLRQGPNEDKIEKYYTKDDPKGLPEIIIKEGKRGTKVDSDDRDEFLLDRLEEFIDANFNGGGVSRSEKEPVAAGGTATTAPKKRSKAPF